MLLAARSIPTRLAGVRAGVLGSGQGDRDGRERGRPGGQDGGGGGGRAGQPTADGGEEQGQGTQGLGTGRPGARQEYKLFMGVFRDRTWDELRRIGTARGSWSDHFPLCFWSGQNKPFPNHN